MKVFKIYQDYIDAVNSGSGKIVREHGDLFGRYNTVQLIAIHIPIIDEFFLASWAQLKNGQWLSIPIDTLCLPVGEAVLLAEFIQNFYRQQEILSGEIKPSTLDILST